MQYEQGMSSSFGKVGTLLKNILELIIIHTDISIKTGGSLWQA